MSGLLSRSDFGVRPRVGVVVLTMGERPKELSRAISSVLAQQLVILDIVVVGNGWRPEFLPAGVRGLHLKENLGIPAGRNAGATKVSGEYIFFLDDDAELADPLFLAEGIKKLEADSSLGLIQPRITDPSGKETPRRWIPRLRKGEASDSSYVFSVLEAAVLMPTRVFEDIGGWGDPYFYAHEGIELARAYIADVPGKPNLIRIGKTPHGDLAVDRHTGKVYELDGGRYRTIGDFITGICDERFPHLLQEQAESA